jgi:hypothetical protein
MEPGADRASVSIKSPSAPTVAVRNAERPVYRRRALNAFVSLCMLLLASYVTQRLVGQARDHNAPAVFVVPFAALAASAWYLAFRYVIHGVVADESGVLIRNGFRSHRLGVG